ncbi:hypothetical protein ACFX19_011610 [Malus domestica]
MNLTFRGDFLPLKFYGEWQLGGFSYFRKGEALRESLSELSLVLGPRSANMAADALTLRDYAELCDVWVDRPSSSLVFVLNNDGLPCPH